jgi:hypothetical protein
VAAQAAASNSNLRWLHVRDLNLTDSSSVRGSRTIGGFCQTLKMPPRELGCPPIRGEGCQDWWVSRCSGPPLPSFPAAACHGAHNRSKRIHKKLVKGFGSEFRQVPTMWRMGETICSLAPRLSGSRSLESFSAVGVEDDEEGGMQRAHGAHGGEQRMTVRAIRGPKTVFQISLRSGRLMLKARLRFPKKARAFRSRKAF